MAGKSVLVTGGTGGIGKATATGLAALGARVGITGRDPARTEAAAAGIRAAPGSPAVDAFAADMSVQAGVRRLAAQVLDTYPRLDVLVNNAGGFWAHRHVTADGLEHTFALNHLAPFLLTSLLLDRLTASAPARIVTVSSGAHARGRIDFDDLQGERNYSGQRAYSQSKLASVMFTYELARRLEGTGVTATVLHPGVWRASHFPDCGSFRILGWKGSVNCQENTRRILRSSAMKLPGWWWKRHALSLMSPANSGSARPRSVTGSGPTGKSTRKKSRRCRYPSAPGCGNWKGVTASSRWS
jgi:NAD(P)-dependent dehydrogenase (short-subunit alcohol dehydrogenase family)